MNKPILITDDEPAFREALCLFLESEGFDCQTAANGLEALKKVRAKFYDVVLLDLLMPRQNGLETLKQIKKYSPKSTVYIVTAYYNIDQALSAQRHGAEKIMLKPLDFDELLLELSKYPVS